ncbi:MAG: glycosyl hydrolase 53 family protein, partial [Treponema sp.]|nr:glycosyl hydrolase 53 family protein [Treponema sp.]
MASAAALILCIMSACPVSDNPGQDHGVIPGSSQFDIPYDMHPLRTAVSSGFIRGADVSNCYEIEQHGGVYRNSDGNAQNIMNILFENGINCARVRLWVDPDKNPSHYAGDGDNTLDVAKAIAVRAKKAGLALMLDIQYSDWWTNPATQQIPSIWKDIPDKQGLLDAVYAYTKDTIQEFTDAGAAPDIVKIGNEINDGFLSQHDGGSSGGTGYALNGWGDYSDALKIAAQAVRETAPDAKIEIHLGDGGSGAMANIFANFTRRASGQASVYTEVDYDIMGLSWYPIYANHLSIDSLYANIRSLKDTFGKDVMVCETGYMWTAENWDSFSNYTGPGNEEIAFSLLSNANGFTSDSDISTALRDDGITAFVPSTLENQARVTRAIMDAVSAAGGMGVMWWGADWIALPPGSGLKTNAEMCALFESTGFARTNGKVLPALRVLGGIVGADRAKPGIVTGLAAVVVGNTVTLNWTAVNSAIASKYELDRATARDGPWTTISDTLTGGSYSDNGLADNAAYYYRVRAYNTNGWGAFCDPVEAETQVFQYTVPTGLRAASTTASSVTMVWNSAAGASSYRLYGAKSSPGPGSAAEPGDSAFALLAETGAATTYTHSGLANGDTWWYKVSAVFVNHG